MSRPRLYLIDGSSQMYRAYHAIQHLTGPDGRSTNAVYGFVTMLRKLLAEQRPEFIAAAFDLAGPTFRSELSRDYKANRRPMPPDLAEQIPWVHRGCEALGVPVLTCERYEADDVIGTLARQAVARGFEVAIVTGDKDFFQLVGDGILVYNPRDEGTWYEAGAVRERMGVAPERVVDALALIGDAIDNIKGVPGIGEKGARDLIGTYGSLDALLARAGELPQKKYREALLAHADAARQSRELLRIHVDVPVDFEPDALRFRGARRAECFELFSALGFRSLLTEYAPDAGTVEKDYRIVQTPADLEALAAELRSAGSFAFQVIPDCPTAMRAAIVGLSFSTAPRSARYVPVGHTALPPQSANPALWGPRLAAPRLSLDEALRALGPILEDAGVRKIGHDLKFSLIVLARHGIELRGIDLDTQLASYLVDAARAPHRLEDLSLEHLCYRAVSEETVRGRGLKGGSLAALPPEAMADYAGERSDLPGQLAGPLRQALARDEVAELYETLERPLIPVLAAIERAGVRIDAAALAAQSERIEGELEARTRQIFGVAGMEFNINSPRQLSEVLFDKLGLPARKRTGKTRVASTASDVLEELALVHELPRQILEWRALQKLKGTYIDALPLLVHPETGRVHTSFNQAVAATGRLSSSEPNLQNIPIRTELGREIRRAFIADPGHLLISADYSQIELRVLAHLSGEPALIEAFRRGEDVHDRTAAKVFGRDSGLDPYELRRRAKIINYALLYGKTAFTLARDIGVTQQAAQEFSDAYFAGFPAVRAFIDETIVRARESGVVKTMYGRRRLVPEVNSRDFQRRSTAEREAVNLPIQGTAADIMKRAMIDVHAALQSQPDARMILTVHDELLFEVPIGRAAELAELVRERMQSAATLKVPLTVDVGIGENWKDAKN